MNHYRKVFHFPNNWGVSVICKDNISYGGVEGMFEAAILKFRDEDDEVGGLYFDPDDYDVKGWLSFQDVADLLKEIESRRKHNGN